MYNVNDLREKRYSILDFRETLKNAKTDLGALSTYSVQGIKDVCAKFGPRPAGDDSEKAAQEFMMDDLKKYCDSISRETFKLNPEAFMGFVKICGGSMLAATASNLLGAFANKKAVLGTLAGVGTAVTALGGEFFFYKKIFDSLYKEKESGNVIAVRKASGETKRRIIISGHTDSAPEWTYTYKCGSHGSYYVILPAVAGLALTVGTAATILCSKNAKLKKGLALSQLAFTPAYAALFKFTDSKRYVDGANDDLSGCYVSSSVLKYLSDNDIRFENTEVICVLAGGEEAGTRGSAAFFEAHPEYKTDGVETVFIGVDTVRDEEYMEIYEKDMNGLVQNDVRVCSLLKNAALKCGKDVPTGAIPLGSTDAASASKAGIPAASFVAMDPAPARYYHTRLDTADILEQGTIEKTIEIMLQAVFDFDEKGLK